MMIPLTEPRFQEIMKDLQGGTGFQNSFFSSYTVLKTFFDNEKLELAEFVWDGKSYIGYSKKQKQEIRFLFQEPPIELIQSLVKEYQLDYVGINELMQKPNRYQGVIVPSEELIVRIGKVATLESKKIRHDYRRALHRNSQLTVVEYSADNHIPKIQDFLEKWSMTRSEEQNRFADIKNDQNFLLLYGNQPGTKGVAIFDGEMIVAYALFIPHELDPNNCVAMLSKVLRGYTDLGMLLAVEKYKCMQKNGFQKAYLGMINNDFKKHFIEVGDIITTWGCQAYKDEKIVFRSSAEVYVNALFA